MMDSNKICVLFGISSTQRIPESCLQERAKLAISVHLSSMQSMLGWGLYAGDRRVTDRDLMYDPISG